MDLKIATLNVRGLRQIGKRKKLFAYIKENNIDITALQECHVTIDVAKQWEEEWNSKMLYLSDTSFSKGLVILFSDKIETPEIVAASNDKRVLLIKCIFEKEMFYVCNVYAPYSDSERKNFFANISYFMQKHINVECKYVIFLGDMNTMRDAILDNVSGDAHDPKVIESFNKAVEALELTDICRFLHGNEKCFSWKRTQLFIARRLDYILISEMCVVNTKSCEIVPYLKSDHDQALLEEYDKIALKMELDEDIKFEGARIHSKQQWTEFGEKPTRFFLLLEKSRACKREIHSLVKFDNTVVSDQQDILKEIFYQFKKQYSCQDIEQLENLDDFIINVEIPQLEEHEVKLCEGLFTMEECYNVVQNMNGEASPGIDGLGAAFYKTFWVKIKHLVLNSLNYAFSNQCLSCSQKRNVVVLIPKSYVNSRQRLDNFRPISLTCTDYKLASI